MPSLVSLGGHRSQQHTHIQLDDPQEGDEEQVKGHKQAEGAADVGDDLALARRHEKVRRRDGHGRGVGGIEGGDGRRAATQVPIASTRHSCGQDRKDPLRAGDKNDVVSFGHIALSHLSLGKWLRQT